MIFKGRAQRSGKANEKLQALKKQFRLPSAGPGNFTLALEKPQRDMLNKREVGCGTRQIEGQALPDRRTVGDIVHC